MERSSSEGSWTVCVFVCAAGGAVCVLVCVWLWPSVCVCVCGCVCPKERTTVCALPVPFGGGIPEGTRRAREAVCLPLRGLAAVERDAREKGRCQREKEEGGRKRESQREREKERAANKALLYDVCGCVCVCVSRCACVSLPLSLSLSLSVPLCSTGALLTCSAMVAMHSCCSDGMWLMAMAGKQTHRGSDGRATSEERDERRRVKLLSSRVDCTCVLCVCVCSVCVCVCACKRGERRDSVCSLTLDLVRQRQTLATERLQRTQQTKKKAKAKAKERALRTAQPKATDKERGGERESEVEVTG